MVTPSQQSPQRPRRWKNLPPRDEHGELRVIITFRPATSALDRQRFDDVARRLYRRWVLEEDDAGPTSATASGSTSAPSASAAQSPAVA
jgi:hypothetical protein